MGYSEVGLDSASVLEELIIKLEEDKFQVS